MATAKDENQKVVEEFLLLVERSQQLFAGLRDLPQYGGTRYWQPYFDKTFAVYSKLWKFQQDHRKVLDNKEYYGLKRYEIGEIASKIGQLYYHYYLRTSETNFLLESFMFYDAIRKRGYFKDVLTSHNQVLVIKKLRYHARFIVVCLLLNMRDTVRELLSELDTLVEQYTGSFSPVDAQEWNVVLQEIVTFLQADAPISVLNKRPDYKPASYRMKTATEIFESNRLHLQEAIIVGHSSNQDKFSELTLDMFRFLQVLEREPSFEGDGFMVAGGGGGGSQSATTAAIDSDKSGDDEHGATTTTATTDNNNNNRRLLSKRNNPHKYLLYRPSFASLMSVLSTTFKDLKHDNSAMLLFLSADGIRGPSFPHIRAIGYNRGGVKVDIPQPEELGGGGGGGNSSGVIGEGNHQGGDGHHREDQHQQQQPSTAAASSHVGGMSVNVNHSSNSNSGRGPKSPSTPSRQQLQQQQQQGTSVDFSSSRCPCLFPADLIPFTRKPLFLIVDSSNSTAFIDMPNLFGQPYIRLLSPSAKPPEPSSPAGTSTISGNLFTLFLCNSFTAFCHVVGVLQVEQLVVDQAARLIHTKFLDIAQQFKTVSVDSSYLRFMEDEYLREIICRYVFCHAVLAHHTKFRLKPDYLPIAEPVLPDSILCGLQVISLVSTLATLLGVASMFDFNKP